MIATSLGSPDALGLIGLVGAVGVGIAGIVYTGLTARRRAHFVLLAIVVPLFVVTIAAAEAAGRSRSFAPTAFRVHMTCAYTATSLLLAALVTGFLRLRSGRRTAHRWAVAAFLVALPCALATGVWMMATADQRIPEPQVRGPAACPSPR